MKKILLATIFTCLCIFSGFSSEKTIDKVDAVQKISFGNFPSYGFADLMASKGASDGFATFAGAIAPYEKQFLAAAIGCTVGFAALSITGIILMVVGYTMRVPFKDWATSLTGLYVEYAGDALFGVSWLFFVAAGVMWAFWGIIQYAKKEGIAMGVFSTNDSIGLSFKF
ncbi:MAG: hypothetical protein KA885_10340 [Spirochaetes bacterium]|nr:hypothetical protein [Spirochaetota bacterium]